MNSIVSRYNGIPIDGVYLLVAIGGRGDGELKFIMFHYSDDNCNCRNNGGSK